MTTNDCLPILVFGYGNPGRQDDGLGIAFSQELEKRKLPNCTTDENYQLNAEDSLLISEFPLVIFVDASYTPEHFSLSRVSPAHEIGFTTHAMQPSSVVGLCHELYGKKPHCYLLEIRGHHWEMKEGLSEQASANLAQALDFIMPVFESTDRSVFLQNLCTNK